MANCITLPIFIDLKSSLLFFYPNRGFMMGLGIRNYFRSLEVRNLVETWSNFKGFFIMFVSPLYLEVFQFILSYLYDIFTHPSYCVSYWSMIKVLKFWIFSLNLICWFFSNFRKVHGHHEHETYYGDRDTESLTQVHVIFI